MPQFMADDLLSRINNINRTMWFGWVLMVLGIISICTPFVASETAVYLTGLFLLVAGVGLLIDSFQSEGVGERLLTLVLGAITSLSAIFLIAYPLLGLGILTLILVAYFVADGLWKIMAAFHNISAPGWFWLLASGALSLLLALLILLDWPVSGLYAVDVLVGVNLLSTGIALVAFARSLKDTFRNALATLQHAKV
jgi:uncharacterized membrane protein HdeD (DUF308 family)